jgi:uncharacterized protein YbaP (TraB family)
VRAAELDHEALDHAMEVEAVVEALLGQSEKVFSGHGHGIEKDLGGEGSGSGVEGRGRVGHGSSPCPVMLHAMSAANGIMTGRGPRRGSPGGRMRRVLTTTALLMILTGLVLAEELVSADRHFVWRTTGESGAVVWLVGSMHALPDSVFPLPEVFDRALDEAELLVLEVDAGDLSTGASALLNAGALPSDQRLPDVLSDETLELLESYLASNGMSLSSFEAMRPWMVSLALTQMHFMRQGFRTDAGLDQVMIRRAAERGLPTMGLETVEDQIGIFSTLSDEEADAVLATGIQELETLEDELENLTTAWREGDTETVLEISSVGFESHPELFRRLVDDRNNAWMPQVRSILGGTRNAVVVVGALHLVGETGLVTQLRNEGYPVVQH